MDLLGSKTGITKRTHNRYYQTCVYMLTTKKLGGVVVVS